MCVFGANTASEGWELYSKSDEMTDQKTLAVEQDNVIDKINVQTTFECQPKQVELTFLLLNKSGTPYGRFENGNKYGYRSELYVSEITYRVDERPPVDKVIAHKYVNSLSLDFSINENETQQTKMYAVEKRDAPMESFLNGKRLRIKLPIAELGNPVVSLDRRAILVGVV